MDRDQALSGLLGAVDRAIEAGMTDDEIEEIVAQELESQDQDDDE
jgi:hypothetical protein